MEVQFAWLIYEITFRICIITLSIVQLDRTLTYIVVYRLHFQKMNNYGDGIKV